MNRSPPLLTKFLRDCAIRQTSPSTCDRLPIPGCPVKDPRCSLPADVMCATFFTNIRWPEKLRYLVDYRKTRAISCRDRGVPRVDLPSRIARQIRVVDE